MPKPSQHQEKADHNRAFLNAIVSSGPADWIAVVAFYTAVHLVEKLRAYRGEHSKDHEERGQAVRKNFRPIHTPYHELFNHSLIARYGTLGKFTLSPADAKAVLVDTYLSPNRELCRRRIGETHNASLANTLIAPSRWLLILSDR
jgi:hypothetical protein